MGKAIGIDYGAKRTGLAITDDLQIIASPLEGIETRFLFEKIDQLVSQETVSEFVLGDPSMLGDVTHSTQLIADFELQLKKKYPNIPIHRVDESFSSRDAMQAMVQGGMKKSKRRDKKNLDMVSATIILQRWLESK